MKYLLLLLALTSCAPAADIVKQNSIWQTSAGAQKAILRNNSGDLRTTGSLTSQALTPNRALTSNSSSTIVPNSATDTELSYLSGTTGTIQAQLNYLLGLDLMGSSFDPTANIAFTGNNTFAGTSDFQGPLSATGDIGGDIPVSVYSAYSPAGRFEGSGQDGLYAISDIGNGLTASSESGAAIFALSNSGGTAHILIGDNGGGTVIDIDKNGTATLPIMSLTDLGGNPTIVVGQVLMWRNGNKLCAGGNLAGTPRYSSIDFSANGNNWTNTSTTPP